MITLVWLGNKVEATNTSPDCFMSFGDMLYYCGDLKPNHNMPAVVGVVRWDSYPGIICIDHPNEDDWVWAYDTWDGKQCERVYE